MKSVILVVLFLLGFSPPERSFKGEQLKFARVKSAYSNKERDIADLLKQKKVTGPYKVFIRAFKEEKVMEVWVSQKDNEYLLLKSYVICKSSGGLGPKRKNKDLQVPEGVYSIERFNPQSSYHLSLGINYPNASDKILSRYSNLGGDIFIHGACVTIGCLPLTDDKIEEVYLLCVDAKSRGQKNIPIHIFPKRMSDDGMIKLGEMYKNDPQLIEFWENLKIVYRSFQEEKKLHTIFIDKKGRYVVK